MDISSLYPAVPMTPKRKLVFPPRYTTARDIANDFELGQAAGQRRYTTSKLCNIYCTYELARRLAETSDARLKSINVSAFDPGMMPGTGLARTYPTSLQFVWNYILPAATLFQRNVHLPTQTGERLGKIVSDSSAPTNGKYYSDGRPKQSSDLSYNKENAADLWNMSALSSPR